MWVWLRISWVVPVDVPFIQATIKTADVFNSLLLFTNQSDISDVEWDNRKLKIK